jgi:penicillin-binding protein 1C
MPGPHCPHTTWTWFIPGVSPIAACDVHRQVLVDKTTGLRACGEGPNAVPKVFEFWPSDLLKIFRQAGVPRRPPPGFDPACGVAAEAPGKAPQITSPLSGVTYSIRSAARGEEIPLTAVTDADARRLYWFVDGRLVGQTIAGRAFFWTPEPGRFTVRVVDDRGRSDAREMLVAYID